MSHACKCGPQTHATVRSLAIGDHPMALCGVVLTDNHEPIDMDEIGLLIGDSGFRESTFCGTCLQLLSKGRLASIPAGLSEAEYIAQIPFVTGFVVNYEAHQLTEAGCEHDPP